MIENHLDIKCICDTDQSYVNGCKRTVGVINCLNLQTNATEFELSSVKLEIDETTGIMQTTDI